MCRQDCLLLPSVQNNFPGEIRGVLQLVGHHVILWMVLYHLLRSIFASVSRQKRVNRSVRMMSRRRNTFSPPKPQRDVSDTCSNVVPEAEHRVRLQKARRGRIRGPFVK